MARYESYRAFWCTKAGEDLDQVHTRESGRGEIKINVDAQLRTSGALSVHEVPGWVDTLNHRVRVEALLDDQIVQLGSYMLKADEVEHAGTHSVADLALIDPVKQVYNDKPVQPLVLAEGDNIVDWVRAGLESVGVELLEVTPSPVVAQSTKVWDMGVERTTAYNEALAMVGYWAIRPTPQGALSLAPYTLPVERSPLVTWRAGEGSLMLPKWKHETDLSGIPNRIIVWNQPHEENAPLITGVASNVNPDDRFSIPNRGVIADYEQSDVENEAAALVQAKKSLDARSVPTANIRLTHALIPGFWGDQIVEAYTSGGQHLLGSVNEATISLQAGKLVSSKLREVRSYG